MEALPKKYQTRVIDSEAMPGVSFTVRPLTKTQRVSVASLHTTGQGHTIIAAAGMEVIRFSLLKIEGLKKPGTEEAFELEFTTTRLGNRQTQVITPDSIDQIPDELFKEIGQQVGESAKFGDKDREKLDPTSTSDAKD